MTINYYFKNFSEAEKKHFEEYFETKLAKLKKMVARYPADKVNLEVKAEKFPTKSAYKVTFVLGLLDKTLYAWEDDHTIAEAIDFAKDKLVRQLKKLKA